MRSPLGLFGLDGKSRVGNLIDVGEQPFEPKGADFLLWGLVSLGHGRGDSSVSCPGLQTTKPRQITRIHLLQSGSGAEREDQSWPGDSKSRPSPLAPRPLPPTRHTPASACPKTKCGLLVAESHVTGVVLVGEVMNAVRKHKQNDGGYPSMHVILCLAASLCLCPPAHHTPRVHTTHTHTHTHTHCVVLCAWLRLSLPAPSPGTHPARAHTHPRPHTACTHASSPYPPPPQTAHEHPAPTRTPLQRVHARTCTHTERCPLPGCDALPLSLPTRHTCKPTHTHSHPAPPRPPHHPPPPTPTYTHTLCCPWPACVSRPLSLPPPPLPHPQAHARAAHSNHATPPGHVTDTPHTASRPPPQHTDTRPTPRTYACARTHTHTRGRTHSAVLCLAV